MSYQSLFDQVTQGQLDGWWDLLKKDSNADGLVLVSNDHAEQAMVVHTSAGALFVKRNPGNRWHEIGSVVEWQPKLNVPD